jgi:hypothetical protein
MRLRTAVGVAAVALSAVVAARSEPIPAKPRLVVLISVDQFRGDYITRFADLLLPARSKEGVGGLRYMMERGAYYPNAHYTHYPLVTGVGHAVLSTGGTPASNGIIGNDWYQRGENGKPGAAVYCVEDADSPIVGVDGARRGVSPHFLRSSTFADELKMATGGMAKVITLSLKDRAAVLLAGRLSDATVWFDTPTGQWVSSRFYCPTGSLPAWVRQINEQRIPDSYFGSVWTPMYPDKVAEHSWAPAGDLVTPSAAVGKRFPHKYTGGLDKPGAAYYSDFWNSPYANEYVLKSALHGARALGMGKDTIPDYIGINLASNDYVGHAFGPNSPEVFDITLRTDRYMAEFFRGLDKLVTGGLKNTLLIVTADHGVCGVPEQLQAAGLYAGRVPGEKIDAAADAALDAKYGADDWVAAGLEPSVWLNLDAVRKHNADVQEARRVAAEGIRGVTGIYDALTWDQLAHGDLPRMPVYSSVANGFYPRMAGDVMAVTENLWVFGGGNGGSTHGSPWSYDTSVPIILSGTGIKPGRYARPATAQEIAPTIASILGVNAPSGCIAQPLVEALQGR